MKKIIVSLALMFAIPAMAQHHHHGRHHNWHYKHHWHNGHNHNWVVPALIGGAAVYIATRPEPRTVIIDQPVIVQKETVCTAWREIQQTDGSIIRERTCHSQ